MDDLDNQVWLIKKDISNTQVSTFINPFDGRIEKREIPDMQGKQLLGSFNEWLVLADEETRKCFLLNLNSQAKIDLPPISEPFQSLGKCHLSSAPTSPDCTIIFVCNLFLLCCRACNKEWTKQQPNLNFSRYSSSVVCKGKLYLSVQSKIIVINLASLFTDDVEITSVNMPEGFRVTPMYDRYYRYIVESCGDIFLVRPYRSGDCSWPFFVEIYRLDSSGDEDWEWVRSIGDRSLFIGLNEVTLLCPDGCAIDHDCIYGVWSDSGVNRLYKFSLIDQTINYMFVSPKTLTSWVFLRVMPTRLQNIKYNIPTSSSLVDLNADASKGLSRPWADLPIELVELCFKHLPLADVMRLPSVCKPWRSLSNPIRDTKLWLVYCPSGDGTFNLFDPLEGRQYTIKLKERLINDPISLLFSKHGWIIVTFGQLGFCAVLNPFTHDIIRLPDLEFQFRQVAFSCVPTSADCVVFGIGAYGGRFIRFIMCRPSIVDEEDDWDHFGFELDPRFYVAPCPPIFFLGEFYCLGTRGELGVFNPDNKTWRVLNKPVPIYSDNQYWNMEFYLVESRGELISIFRGVITPFIHVFKLDQATMAWGKLEDLGDVSIFLGCGTSLAKTFASKKFNNKLYFPRLHDGCRNDKGEFFSMDEQKYTPDFNNVKVPVNCVWLEPQLDRLGPV